MDDVILNGTNHDADRRLLADIAAAPDVPKPLPDPDGFSLDGLVDDDAYMIRMMGTAFEIGFMRGIRSVTSQLEPHGIGVRFQSNAEADAWYAATSLSPMRGARHQYECEMAAIFRRINAARAEVNAKANADACNP